MRLVIVLISALQLAACASIDITPPEERDFVKSRVYALSFEETWAHAVDWFAGQNVSIDTLEKPSGLITAKYHIDDRKAVVDCGDIQVSNTIYKGEMSQNSFLNVTIRALSEEQTRVNIYFFSDYTVKVQEVWAERVVSKSGQCVSTGKLEKSIFETIVD